MPEQKQYVLKHIFGLYKMCKLKTHESDFSSLHKNDINIVNLMHKHILSDLFLQGKDTICSC